MVRGDSCRVITHVEQIRAGAIQVAVLFLAWQQARRSQNNLVTFVPERLNELELACGGRRPRIGIESQGNEVLRGLDESILVTQ